MKTRRLPLWVRATLAGVVCGMVFLTAGDKAAQTALIGGIDPLEVLNLEIRNNVMFVFDTSGSMTWVLPNSTAVGDDDPMSRMFQAKKAVNEIVENNMGRVNFGMASYDRAASSKPIGGNRLHYVSFDAEGADHDNFTYTNPSPPYETRYYIRTSRLRDDVQYEDSVGNNASTIDCAAVWAANPPPAGYLSTDDYEERPCFQIEEGGDIATFWYTATQYSSDSSCDGARLLQTVEDTRCDPGREPVIIAGILDNMQLTAPMSLVNDTAEYPPSDGDLSGRNPPVYGLRAGQRTPLGNSLVDIYSADPDYYFPPQTSVGADTSENFVVLLTDGDDTCSTDAEVIQAAQNLYNGNGADPRRQATTLVVAFTSAVNMGDADNIAHAGSGDEFDAFPAEDYSALILALQNIIELALAEGEFAASAVTIASVFELGPLNNPSNCVPYGDPTPNDEPYCADPLVPNTRYNNRMNVLYQPTFDLPDFEGHLYAYLNDGTFQPVGSNYTSNWDAGETLFEQISQMMEDTAPPADAARINKFTFGELHGGASAGNIGSSSALIKRRVFTSSPVAGTGPSPVNRTFARGSWDASTPAGTNVVALWPPNQAGLSNGLTQDIDPALGATGALDDLLGIDAMTFAELRDELDACTTSGESTQPAACVDSDFDGTPDNPATALEWARKEARQILLAWFAGAGLALGGDSLPLRDPSTFELYYSSRGWLLKDSTLAQPAVATPPLRLVPGNHVREWMLFSEGRRDQYRQGINEIDSGFGMRNPDYDNASPESYLLLKPVMTVVYLPANDGVHAFRAGPNCSSDDPTLCAESGSEELWHFMPIDQLGKIKLLREGQTRANHKYVISTAVRLVDIFVETGLYTLEEVDYTGRWRTVIFFGRGPGGKFLTALDVTAPGPFTRIALETNPPFVMWNHGNEDGVGDDYDGMGQTWSVPAIGNVNVAFDANGLALEPEWRLWTGSGYSENPAEGTTFYQLDAVTGEVLFRMDVGDGDPTHFADNALVASPSAYNAFEMDWTWNQNLTRNDRSPDYVTRVYIPDIHGRIWKFNTVSGGGQVGDEGEDQPFGSGFGLLKIDNMPHLYGVTGNDNRVPDTNPFNLYAYRDTASDIDVLTQLTLLDGDGVGPGFPHPLVDGDGNYYRGTAKPATAFNANGYGRVFAIGTRYVCDLNRFDTVLFGLLAVRGGSAYDFNGSDHVVIQGNRAPQINIVGGVATLGDSGGLGDAPGAPTPPPNMPPPSAATPAEVAPISQSVSSPVCRSS